uniref:Uncharacterized protein n=1 Tax=Rhipicephalus zambeziensis TaxID=60191 RepID=A0A224YAY3_9ACAR
MMMHRTMCVFVCVHMYNVCLLFVCTDLFVSACVFSFFANTLSFPLSIDAAKTAFPADVLLACFFFFRFLPVSGIACFARCIFGCIIYECIL